MPISQEDGLEIYDVDFTKKHVNKTFFNGLVGIALVEEPAIEENFIALSSINKKEYFASDDVKQILTGPALVPGKKIYRFDKQKQKEFYIRYSAESIEYIAKNESITNALSKINIGHNSNRKVKATVMEKWIVTDKNKDKAAALGFDVPVGTLMVSLFIHSRRQYETLKEKSKGFSIEGYFDFILSKEKYVEQFKNTNTNINKKSNMKLSDLFKKKVEQIAVKTYLVKRDDKIIPFVAYEGKLYFADDSADVAPEGEHRVLDILENKEIIITIDAEGNITNMTDAEEVTEDVSEEVVDETTVEEEVVEQDEEKVEQSNQKNKNTDMSNEDLIKKIEEMQAEIQKLSKQSVQKTELTKTAVKTSQNFQMFENGVTDSRKVQTNMSREQRMKARMAQLRAIKNEKK